MKRGDIRNKSGQVTIFIIIGILVVAGVVLFFTLRPEMDIAKEKAIKKPQTYIHSCIKPELEEIVRTVSLQGGSLNPNPSTIYNGEKIAYLCYVDIPYYECIVQQPFLKTHIKEEIKKGVESDVENCFNQLEQIYEEEGYNVNLKRGDMKIELIPEKIIIKLPEYKINVVKGEDAKDYEDFEIGYDYNLYKMVGIANDIVKKEVVAGKAEPMLYMYLYHDLKIERDNKYDGTNIYTITDRNTQSKFRFASRSLFFP